jgi:signal transduction histidine kinase
VLRRLPIESAQPILVFAVARLLLAVLALIALLVLGLPYDGRGMWVVAGVVIPWSVVMVWLARRQPELALNPLVAAGDVGAILLFQVVVPEAYGAARFAALFALAAHAHFQGERRGMAIAAAGAAALVLATALRGDAPVSGNTLAFWDSVFVLAAISIGAVVGTLRTSESASRLRARRLSRRTLRAESEARRRVAETIHDGPVQELIGLDIVLSAARQAVESDDRERGVELLDEARELTERNIRALRDEIVELGPYAFEELRFGTAIENCLPAWRRRFGFEVLVSVQELELDSEVEGNLFRIAQEAVVNAGRHARAQAVSISLRQVDGDVELRVTDDGQGFAHGAPLEPTDPGHLGLATMRERAELIGGTLDLATSERGTRVLVRAPLAAAAG